jgi:hypothetical protein
VTQDELAALARRPDQRLRDALAGGGEPLAVYRQVEELWRGFVGLLADWTALTVQWLLERDGAAAASPLLRPEHAATLAARRGLGLERLERIAALERGPDHALRDRLAAALDSGDGSAAQAVWREAIGLMDDGRALRIDTVNEALGLVHARYSDSGLNDALTAAAERGFWHDWLPGQAATDADALIAETAAFLTAGAGCELHLIDEPDRYVVEFVECHCGRAVRDARANGWSCATVDGPSPLTYGQPQFTAYQTHFAVIHGSWAIDAAGAPTPPFDCLGTATTVAGGRGPRCRNYVYKEPVPERFYAALGRARP